MLDYLGYEFTNKQVRLCRAICDPKKTGHISFENLLALFIYLKWVQCAFDMADADKSDSIDIDEILGSLSKFGHSMDDKTVCTNR